MISNPDGRPNIDEVRTTPEDDFSALHAELFNFAVGSSNPLADHKKWIKEIGAPFLKRASASCSVLGMTDRTGNADFNQKLSMRRVEAVINAFLDEGVQLHKFDRARGDGEQVAAEMGQKDGTANGQMRAVSVLMIEANVRSFTPGTKRVMLKRIGVR